MPFTHPLENLVPRGQTPITGCYRRLTTPLKQSLSKIKNLVHISDRHGRAREHDCRPSSTSSTNTISPHIVPSLSTISEISEPTEGCLTNNTFVMPSIPTPPQGFIRNSVGRHDSNAFSVSTISTARQTFPITLSFHSPLSSTPERDFKHSRTSYGNTTTSTVSSIFNAYEEEGIADDPICIIAELEMYVPVTSAMVRTLLTKAHLFPGRALDATQLAAFLEASCNEVSAFLSACDGWNVTSPNDPSKICLLDDFSTQINPAGQFRYRTQRQHIADFGSTRIVWREAKARIGRNHRSVHDVLDSGKQNLKCNLANLILRIPSRGPRWLMDRVLLWTIVGEHPPPPSKHRVRESF